MKPTLPIDSALEIVPVQKDAPSDTHPFDFNTFTHLADSLLKRIARKEISLIRNIGKWMGLPLVVLFLWFLFDRNRQSLHDKIAKTLVVEGK